MTVEIDELASRSTAISSINEVTEDEKSLDEDEEAVTPKINAKTMESESSSTLSVSSRLSDRNWAKSNTQLQEPFSKDITPEAGIITQNSESEVTETEAYVKSEASELQPVIPDFDGHNTKVVESLKFSLNELSCKKPIADITAVCDVLVQSMTIQLPANACLAIKDSLIAHGQTVFREISCDPPRWIIYATLLCSEILFKEAAIHIIGCWPSWPWHTSKEAISGGGILQMLAEKSQQLQLLRHGVDRKLLLATIQYRKTDRVVPATFKLSTEASLAVAQFGQWFRNRLYKLQQAETQDADPCLIGAVYHKIHSKADYLIAEKVMEEFSDVSVNFPFYAKELCECLTDLKDHLAEIVEPVVKNNLMLHVKDHCQIKHLTCAEIDDNDIPWKDRNEGAHGQKRKASALLEPPAKKNREH